MILLIATILIKIVTYTLWLGGVVPGWGFLLILNPLTGFMLFTYLKRYQKNQLYPYTALVFDLCIPFVAFVGISLFYCFGFIFRYINYKDEEDDYLLPMGAGSYQAFELEKRIEIQNSYEKLDKEKENILSFMEVEPLEEALLGVGALQVKISAIDQLSRIGSRKAILIIKKALKLSEYEVRYFANGALEEIEKKRLFEIKKISEIIAENPDGPDGYKERGAAYIEMFRLGLLDKSIEAVFLEKALIDFMTSLSLAPDQSYLYTRIIEINLLLKNYDELLHLAEFALKANLSELDKAKIYFYKAEASYIKKDYHKAKEFCDKASLVKTDFLLINSCLDWWAHAS